MVVCVRPEIVNPSVDFCPALSWVQVIVNTEGRLVPEFLNVARLSRHPPVATSKKICGLGNHPLGRFGALMTILGFRFRTRLGLILAPPRLLHVVALPLLNSDRKSTVSEPRCARRGDYQ